MKKSELKEKIAGKLGVSQVLAEKIINFFDDFTTALAKEEKVTLTAEKSVQQDGVSISFRMSGKDKEQTLEVFEHRSEAE